jgi:hypothetical protein
MEKFTKVIVGVAGVAVGVPILAEGAEDALPVLAKVAVLLGLGATAVMTPVWINRASKRADVRNAARHGAGCMCAGTYCSRP